MAIPCGLLVGCSDGKGPQGNSPYLELAPVEGSHTLPFTKKIGWADLSQVNFVANQMDDLIMRAYSIADGKSTLVQMVRVSLSDPEEAGSVSSAIVTTVRDGRSETCVGIGGNTYDGTSWFSNKDMPEFVVDPTYRQVRHARRLDSFRLRTNEEAVLELVTWAKDADYGRPPPAKAKQKEAELHPLMTKQRLKELSQDLDGIVILVTTVEAH